AVGEAEVAVAAELLDGAEDVIPASRVEAGGMMAQLVEYLVHLEGGENRLDQHRRPDRAARDQQVVLRHHENVVPESRLEMALHLRQVEIPATGRRGELPCVLC